MEGKIWRQPTLAEPIEPLPLAMLCLTAEFGMGSGRATALWPPKKCFRFKERPIFGDWRVFVEYYTQVWEWIAVYNPLCFKNRIMSSERWDFLGLWF
jgi:hypothetical protein